MRVRFDRGTLVLEVEAGIAGAKDPSQIPGAAWDEQSRAWRVPAERYRDLRVRPLDEQIRIPDTPSEKPLEGAWKLPALRWYQTTALARWKTAGRRGVIALPTGSGKTMVALGAIAELGVPALIVVPTRVLLDQWTSVLANVWSGPVGRIGDGDYQVEQITVCTYSSAAIWASRIGDHFGLVIVDEAHHVGAWCPGEVLEMLVAPARLGLTATPPPPGGELGARIGSVVYTLAVDDLKGDALADYELESVPVALAKLEGERYRTLRSRFASFYATQARRERGQMDWRKFLTVATRSAAGREALDAWKDYRSLIAYSEGKRVALRKLLAKHRGERTLVFTADVATAYQIARELLVMPITHEIGRAERAQVIEKFRTGESTVLVSAQVLDEGFDVPDADVAIIVGGSSSMRRQVQRIGRVLRPREGKKAVIYELAVLETTEIDYVRRRHGEMEDPATHTGSPLRGAAVNASEPRSSASVNDGSSGLATATADGLGRIVEPSASLNGDSSGLATATADGLGRIVEPRPTTDGRLGRIVEPRPSAANGGSSGLATVTADGLGRIVGQGTRVSVNGSSGLATATADGLGRIVEPRPSAANGDSSGLATVTADELGRIVEPSASVNGGSSGLATATAEGLGRIVEPRPSATVRELERPRKRHTISILTESTLLEAGRAAARAGGAR